MANKFRFHWFAPFLMLGSFALAILLCFGHHLFYQSLEGSRVSSTDRKLLGARFTAQQVNIAGGTAFAFLAKAAFVLSVSTAYYQAFWKMARQSPARGKPPTLGRLDDAFSALNNILALANLPLWFRFPLLFVIAITAWSVCSSTSATYVLTGVQGYCPLLPSSPQPRFLSTLLGAL